MQGVAALSQHSAGAHRAGDAGLCSVHVPEVQGHRFSIFWASCARPCAWPASPTAILSQAQLPLVRRTLSDCPHVQPVCPSQDHLRSLCNMLPSSLKLAKLCEGSLHLTTASFSLMAGQIHLHGDLHMSSACLQHPSPREALSAISLSCQPSTSSAHPGNETLAVCAMQS